MKLSFHLHLPSFKLFADDFNELSDAVDFLTLTAGFAMEQWREVQVKILIDGKTSHEDDTRLDTVILAVHGVIIRSFGEPVLRQQVRQSVQDRPDDILDKYSTMLISADSSAWMNRASLPRVSCASASGVIIPR